MNVAVLGAGTMGNGIAQVFAQNGHDVVLRDLEAPILDRALGAIAKSLGKLAEKGRLTAADGDAALSRIRAVTDLGAAASADLVVEAVVENLEVKARTFAELDALTSPAAILASNTSSISITRLGAATRRPDKVIGMHFMNPVPLMALVEVIRGQATSDQTTRTVMDTARALGKTPVEVNDYPGFVSNRVLMPMINEAVYCVYEGVAQPEAIDQVMKLGMNHPMGPLTLADFIGLDVCLAILRVLEQGFGDPKYRPCPLLVKMVDAGWLG
ncbi:MAG TPA: 3-hydroxybutyryl-CoA dehydrogenase, partial [Vicinamibacteria bacterium]